MSTPFSRSLRSLTADRGRRSLGGMLLATALLSAWAVWFCLARLTLYEVTTLARLEVDRAVYPIAAPVAGQIVATHLRLGHEVQTSEVLVELETEAPGPARRPRQGDPGGRGGAAPGAAGGTRGA
jgi:membrane fusion protein (multidrug efflux system)